MMRSTIAALALTFLCASAQPARAAEPKQGSLRGFVFQPDGLPIPDTRVVIAGATIARTDDEGMFLVALPAGPVMLSFAPPGHAIVSLEKPIPVLEGQETEIILTLPAKGPATLEVESPERAIEAVDELATTRGRVRGVVRGNPKGLPVINARVFIRGARGDTRTDGQGRFELELPIGPRELTIIHPSYSTAALPVTITASVAEVEIRLEEKSIRLAEVVITAPRIEGSALEVLKERQDSSSVADVLGADQISKTGDSDAAAALSRVTGITVVGGRYIYVRGLGERYSATQLNGANIPSPDPERRVVPLDLFPASAISGITVQKTHSPNLPGEFGGGMVQIKTKDIPEEPVLSLGVSGRFVTNTSLLQGLDYPGSASDFLGFGAGGRALPDDLRAQAEVGLVRLGDRFNPGLDSGQIEQLGEQLDPVAAGTPTTLPPDFGVSLEAGGKFDLWGARAGALVGADYSNGWFLKDMTFNNLSIDGAGALRPSKSFRVFEAQNEVALSGLGSFALSFDDDHRIQVGVGVFRISTDRAQRTTGIDEDVGGPIEIHVLEWAERMVNTNQIRGTHLIAPDLGLRLEWRYQLAIATSDQPNRRALRYFEDQGALVSANDGNERLYASLFDIGHQAGVDLSLPVTIFGAVASKIQAGVDVDVRSREVQTRRYFFRRPGGSPESIAARSLPPNNLFRADTIDPAIFQLEETTRGDDNYFGDHLIVAGYGMIDLGITDSLSVLFGARVELSNQSVDVEDALGIERTTAAELDQLDVLPSVTGTWAFVEDMQVRLALAATVNRPNFRELSPGAFLDQTRGLEYRGNPDLERAFIYHADARWEWYPSPGESVSVAAFAKVLEDPIESSLQLGANPVAKPINTAGATNFGVELEGRKDLSFLGEGIWESVYVAGNLTLVQSSVNIGEQAGVLTSSERPLQGQSPYAINAQLGYDDPDVGLSGTLLFNVFGPRISDVGVLGLPDVFELPQPTLDLVIKYDYGRFHFGLKLQNIFDAPVRFAHTEPSTGALVDRERYDRGRRVSLSFTVDLDGVAAGPTDP